MTDARHDRATKAQQSELEQLRQENARLTAALGNIAEYAPAKYWRIRDDIDAEDGISNWVRGEDWPCYPLMLIYKRCGDILSANTPTPTAEPAAAPSPVPAPARADSGDAQAGPLADVKLDSMVQHIPEGPRGY